ncbi:MAG: helix-turn-helix domain-containing protein, partial [Rhodanobacteraceae bacterium]
LRPIRSERDYKSAVRTLDSLIDAGGADESHALADLVALVGEFIAEYEQRKGYVLPEASGAQMLRHFMARDGLRQADLPEIGSQGVVSEVLSGKRDLNARQIRALSQRFGVGASAFL